MRSRPILVLLAVAALVLSACGGGGGDDAAAPDSSPTADGTAAEQPSLDDGVAAVVNGEEIPADLLEQRVEAAAASPELAELLESEDGDAARAQLRASVLSQLIVNQLVTEGAEARGLSVDEDAIATTRDELATEAGGEEAFDEQVAQAGLDEDQLQAELEAVTALRLVRDDLQEEAGASPAPAASPGGPTSGDALLQQWLLEQLTTARIAVAPEVGSWDPARGTVVPPGGAPTAPQAPPAPDGGEATAPATTGPEDATPTAGASPAA